MMALRYHPEMFDFAAIRDREGIAVSPGPSSISKSWSLPKIDRYLSAALWTRRDEMDGRRVPRVPLQDTTVTRGDEVDGDRDLAGPRAACVISVCPGLIGAVDPCRALWVSPFIIRGTEALVSVGCRLVGVFPPALSASPPLSLPNFAKRQHQLTSAIIASNPPETCLRSISKGLLMAMLLFPSNFLRVTVL